MIMSSLNGTLSLIQNWSTNKVTTSINGLVSRHIYSQGLNWGFKWVFLECCQHLCQVIWKHTNCFWDTVQSKIQQWYTGGSSMNLNHISWIMHSALHLNVNIWVHLFQNHSMFQHIYGVVMTQSNVTPSLTLTLNHSGISLDPNINVVNFCTVLLKNLYRGCRNKDGTWKYSHRTINNQLWLWSWMKEQKGQVGLGEHNQLSMLE